MMASRNLRWCVAALRGEGILVNGHVLSGDHASLGAALRVDVPHGGKPTEKRHVLVTARYGTDCTFPVDATFEIDVTKPMTTESVIRRWVRDLNQSSIWHTGRDREFKITGPRSYSFLGTATPLVMMHCSAMMMMASAVANAEPEGSHLGIAAQHLAYRLYDRLNTVAEEFDELAGG